MTTAPDPPAPATNRSVWTLRRSTPLTRFMTTESGSAGILLVAALVAMVWANVAPGTYDSFWHTELALSVGTHQIAMGAVEWVNSGLMTFFFFVVGLEARRELDIGELRERRRMVLPVTAGIAGMAAAVGIYLLVNLGHDSAAGWGVAMSTDTAFALGVLALIGPRFPERLRVFLLTVVVVDDAVALAAIAVVYSDDLRWQPLAIGLAIFGVITLLARRRVRAGIGYLVAGVACWVALHASGVDPVTVGLAMGLLTYAAPADRDALEVATLRFRDFREQPTPALARSARAGLDTALSPNERLQARFHPWTSYLVVPLFALANVGVPLRSDLLADAATSPITLGIIAGYVVGKPWGITVASWLVARASRGRLRPPVGWLAVLGGGTTAGIGFTVSLLIATIAFDGQQQQEAKLGILVAAIGSAALTWVVFRVSTVLPPAMRGRALFGSAAALLDLADPVADGCDHARGPIDAPVTLVEYGDFECPSCGQAEPAVRELLTEMGDLRYVWRHLPLHDVHPHAQLAAEASEVAARQGAFWPMREMLIDHQGALTLGDVTGYAAQLGLDVARFSADMAAGRGAARVRRDLDSADRSGVRGTPTFFVNGVRHHGAYDVETLREAVRLARLRAAVSEDDSTLSRGALARFLGA